MPNESVYGLAVVCSRGYNSLAYNLYVPVAQTRVESGDDGLDVLRVTPERIVFQHAGQPSPKGRLLPGLPPIGQHDAHEEERAC